MREINTCSINVNDKASAPTRRGWGRGRVGTNYRSPGTPVGDSGPDYVAFVFVFLGGIIICQLYKLILPD